MKVRLQVFSPLNNQIQIMVLGEENSIINDNDYYLLNNSIIRKGIRGNIEPEFIFLDSAESKFIGLFKQLHVADGENESAVCWDKVY